MATRVLNSLGDHEESVERIAKHLGRGPARRAIFRLIYGKGTRGKTSQEVIEALAPMPPQTVRNELAKLSGHGLILTDGAGRSVRYSKEPFIAANKAEIIKFANNPKLREAVPTKRRPQIVAKLPLATKSYDRTSTRGRGSTSSRIKVLYLTAAPSSQKPLRTEAEVAMVQEEVRGSKHRDKVEIVPRPAASQKTLRDALNDLSPQVVHFSGHGGRGGVWFDDGKVLKSIGGDVSFDLLNATLAAVDKPPVLLVLNACDTLKGADVLLDSVSVVVAMSDSISDLGAATFATGLYGAIAAGQSLASALKQAVVSMRAATLNKDAQLPQMIRRKDVDPAKLRLVS